MVCVAVVGFCSHRLFESFVPVLLYCCIVVYDLINL